MASISDGAIRVFATLHRHRVEFLVIGGQAEALMGSPRPTYDTDIAYARDPANLERLAAALRELEAKLRVNGQPLEVPFPLDAKSLAFGNLFTWCTNVGEDFDVLGYVEPVGTYEDMLPAAERYRLDEGFDLLTISLEDLLRVKEYISRQKDAESLQQLRALKRMRDAGDVPS